MAPSYQLQINTCVRYVLPLKVHEAVNVNGDFSVNLKQLSPSHLEYSQSHVPGREKLVDRL